jgi:hypothetical protein
MNAFFDLLSKHCYKINTLMWAAVRAHGIIARLTGERGGNVHDRHVVEITSRSFEKETHGANPNSGHMIMMLIMR